MSKYVSGLLPQVTLSILFALSLKPQYGYQLIQQIEDDSGGKVQLGPGALYGSLRKLREDGLIEELPFEHERRRYYRLTRKGWNRLSADLEYFGNIVRLARKRKVFPTDT